MEGPHERNKGDKISTESDELVSSVVARHLLSCLAVHPSPLLMPDWLQISVCRLLKRYRSPAQLHCLEVPEYLLME